MSTVPRVVLIQPPLLLCREFIDYPYFTAMAAAQAGAVLRGCGVEVELLDGMSGPGADFTEQGDDAWLGRPRETFQEQLEGLTGRVVVINTPPFLLAEPGRKWLAGMAKRLERAGAALVVLAEMYMGGMHHLDLDPAGWLDKIPGAPLLLRFEGEALLARLADELAAGRIPAGEIWEQREPVPEQQWPEPAWDLLDLEAYFDLLARCLGARWRPGPMPPEPTRSLPLVTARGCPYGCIFCTSNPGLADRRLVRAVPLERVAAWLDRWVAEHGLQRVVLLDELANLSAARLDGLLDLVEQRGLGLELPNGLRADRLTREQVGRLAAISSGVKVSLESASPRVQREVLGKDLDPAAVERVAEWCRDLGCPLQVHCLIGLPGEQPADMLQTVRLAARLHEEYGARPLLQNATPLPGSELHQICVENGLLRGDPSRPWAAFQGQGMIQTEDFAPELLDRARLALERRLAPDPPGKVIVNLTYLCNNHCVFCAVGTRPQRHADTGEVLAQLRRHRAAGCELLDIDGGEPTLHKDLLKVVRAGRALGYSKIAVISNGRRLGYDKYTAALLHAGVDELLISLHAPDEALNARLTGAPGAWEQTVAGITTALKLCRRSARVAVNTTITAANLDALRPLGDLLARLGVVRWNLQLVTPFGRAALDQMPAEEALTAALERLLDTPPPGVRLQLVNCPPCLVPGHEDKAAADFGKAARSMVFVGAEGENLQDYLATRRAHTDMCNACVEAINCRGEYLFTK